MNCFTNVDSPLGELLLISDGNSLSGVYLETQQLRENFLSKARKDEGLPLFKKTAEQLREYFCAGRTEFDLPLKMEGSTFQKSVWKELCKIPYGTSTSYGEIARRLSKPAACRAVGLANGRNPISIIVPCHRVIGKNGSLTGYGGGLEAKEFLLKLEVR